MTSLDSHPVQVTTAPAGGGRRFDAGAVVALALFTLLLIGKANYLGELMGAELPGAELALELTTAVLTTLLCLLVVVAYLRRAPAQATASGLLVRVLAVGTCCLPLGLAMSPPTGRLGQQAVGAVLVFVGTAFSVWSMAHLSRAFSVLPQARHVVSSGPYRFVRHPLYLGETVALLGLALTLAGVWPLVVVALVIAGQIYRAGREEAVLAAQLPEYAAYAARTWRVLPGLV